MALLRAAARARVRRLVGSGPPALATFAGADRATGGRGGAAGERALQAMRLCCATPSVASVGRDVKAPVSPPAGASVTLVVEQATRFATATTALPLPLAKIPAAGRGGGPRSAGILVATVAVGSKGAHFATASAPERALLTLERAQQATSPCPPLAAPRILCRGLSLSTVAGDKKARRFSSTSSAGDDQSKSLEKKEPLSRRARADDPAPAVEEPLEPLKEMEQSVLRALKAIQKVILRSFSEQE